MLDSSSFFMREKAEGTPVDIEQKGKGKDFTSEKRGHSEFISGVRELEGSAVFSLRREQWNHHDYARKDKPRA